MPSAESQKQKTLQFLWTIGELYANTNSALSSFYFTKYQKLLGDTKESNISEKLCQYCGSMLDGVYSRTRILKKVRSKKHKTADKRTSKRLKKNCVIAKKCDSCKRISFIAACERMIVPTHLKTKKKAKAKQKAKQGATTLPNNYSSLSSSAKRKWRRHITANKTKEQGISFWKGSTNTEQHTKDTNSNLMAFLSSIEK